VTFRLLTANLLQAIRSTDCAVSFISQRSGVIGAFRSSYCSIVPASTCSLSGPLLYRSPVVVFLDRGYPCFRNFNSTIPVGVVRVKSYGNSFLDPTCVPVRISINKLDLIPDRIVACLVGVFRNGGGLGTSESYIPVMFFDPLLHRSPCFPDVDFAVLTGNPSCLAGLTVSFGCT